MDRILKVSKKTPLYARHVSLDGNMVSFGGYLMPIYYTSIIQEHNSVRNNAGLFDVSHMGEFHLSGPDSESFLQKMTVNDVGQLYEGRAQYSAMCYDSGGIVDDLLIYKKVNGYMLVVNATNRKKDYQWLYSNLGKNVYLEDHSDEMSLIAIQGPKSRNILQRIVSSDLSDIAFYHFIEYERIAGTTAMIARTGYTGELGYEIYAKTNSIVLIWDALMDLGEKDGLVPTGLGCRDTLRMEMKYVLYGNDIDENTSPVEAGLSWIIKQDKGDFIGRGAIIEKMGNPDRKLVCFTMKELAIPRRGFMILKNGNEIGIVTSGTMSPSLEKGIGMGYVTLPHHTPGTEIMVNIRGQNKSAIIAESPLYKNGTATK